MIIEDKLKRKFYIKPANDQLHIYNRPFLYTNSNAITHANDIYDISQKKEIKPKVLALFSDNGPDFNPQSYLVFFALGRLWQKLKLDHLFLSSYAPYSSKYNSIEVAWGTMSLALAQTMLVKDAQNYDEDNQNHMIEMFERALSELSTIWPKTKYADKNVKCQSLNPNSKEMPFDDYLVLKDVFDKGKNSNHFHLYKDQIKFLFRHCSRRKYYLHFKKCEKLNYQHCREERLEKSDEINEVIEHLNDLFVGKAMTTEEMRLLQHIVDHICSMSNENQLLRIYNQEQIKPFSSNH